MAYRVTKFLPESVCGQMWPYLKISELYDLKVFIVILVLPYGGHDGDGEKEGVGKCPLVAPTLHLV